MAADKDQWWAIIWRMALAIRQQRALREKWQGVS